MKKFFMFFLLSFVLVLGACGNGDDDADTTDDSASTSDFDAEEFARTNCTSCHGQDFTGAMGPDLTGLDEGTITDAVREGPGSMPSYNENKISDEDLDVLAGFFSEM